MRVAIVGLGLIGGSIARALGARRGWPVVAWDPDPATLRAAARAHLVRPAAEAQAAVAGAELAVLAAPPLINLQLVERLGPVLSGTDTTLTDVSSAKAMMLARADAVAGLHFVGGHPLSGREQAGFRASKVDLFAGRPWAMVAGRAARPRDVARVRALVRACRARPLVVEAAEHDRAVALISHLPLLLSTALAEVALDAPDWPLARQLAAQGFASGTRLARGDPALGAGILANNPGPVAAAVEAMVRLLAERSTELKALGGQAEASPEQVARLEAWLADLRDRLEGEVRLP